MAKKKQIEPWPWRIRGIYVVLGISLFTNAITIAVLSAYANQ